MKVGTETKAKFKKLQRRLGLSLWQCVGLLECLWQLTASSAPDGGLGRLSNEDIAASIEWQGDEQTLIQQLIECRWLDEYPDPAVRFVVHDWSEHCPNFVKGNERLGHFTFLVPPKVDSLGETKRSKRAANKTPCETRDAAPQAIPDGAPRVRPDAPPHDPPTIPSQTTPNPTNPIQTLPSHITPSPPNSPIAATGGPATGSPAGGGGDDALLSAIDWDAALAACEAAGCNTIGALRLVETCRERGILPSHLVEACRYSATNGFHNPPGALNWWAKSHAPSRLVCDRRSWPSTNVKTDHARADPAPPVKRPPTPQELRNRLDFQATRLAREGRALDAARLLEEAQIPRDDWPVVVLVKLERQGS
jgi:hypothetical protein